MKNSMTKQKYALLALAPLAASLTFSDVHAEDGVLLRYQPGVSEFTLSVDSDILAGEKEQPVAGRNFTMKYEPPAGADAGSFNLKLADAKASYTAHGMKQRLGTRHLVGKEFGLEISDEGRGMHLVDHKSVEIEMGPITDHGYGLDEALVALLPALPLEPVGVGSTWTTDHGARALVGWAWAQGQLQCHHELVELVHQGDHQIASVNSACSTDLAALNGSDQYSGDGQLSRTTQWQFDATDGRLISFTGQQESNGFSALPQGNVQVRQLSKISLNSES
jgi:hypothetical protein